MSKNIGVADKAVRIILAIIIGILYFTHVINGTIATIAGALAIIFVFTAFVGTCPLYLPFGINTGKKK
jgi:uncharacterized membrane protein